jgi:hypothetical protein
MASPDAEHLPAYSHAGLCRACLHVRLVRTSRESTFYLCRRSEKDPAYARYPRLPMILCAGFEQNPEQLKK